MAYPNKDVLLKEYKMCQQEATSTANWLWTSSSIFLGVWIAGMAIAGANIDKIGAQPLWLLAVLAVAAQVLWTKCAVILSVAKNLAGGWASTPDPSSRPGVTQGDI